MNWLKTSLLFLLVTIWWSCNTASKYTRTGDKYAAEGNAGEASTYYYNALLKKKGYPPAKTGLQTQAQVVLKEKFDEFRNLVLANKLEPAITQYEQAQAFTANAASVGVILDWPEEFDEVYADIRKEYARNLFNEAIELIRNKKFDFAERTFRTLATIDTAYRNVSVLRMNTVLQPLYNEGDALYRQGLYREAYQVFLRLTEIDDEFSDVAERKAASLDKAVTKFGILPASVPAGVNPKPFNDWINTHCVSPDVFTSVSACDIVSRQLQSKNLSQPNTPEMAIQIGKALGYQVVFQFRISKITDTIYEPINEWKTAYEAVTENIPNPYTETYAYITKFKKVKYRDWSKGQEVSFRIEILMIDCEKGNIRWKELDEYARKDELHRFDFSGNVANLYETLPSGNNLPPVNQDWRDMFTQPRKDLLSPDVLKAEVLTELAIRASQKVNKSLR